MERLNGTETVLVVDDENIGLSMAHAMLTRYGYGALTASSGEEALRLFQQWPDLRIDIAVIDIVMPVMDGFELTKRLRKVRPQLPIIYMSAYSENSDLRPEESRNVPYLPKPFTSLKLTAKIREVLDSSRSDAAGQS
jgi:two-component system, cell cycle sensor histidine kinase and response regulator CckA